MPYINTVTTRKISDSERNEIKSELGKIISLFPGKSEDWLMLSFSDDVKMYFRGDDGEDTAYVEVKIFGICELYEEKLGIPSERIYVKYEECDKWGWNGSNF